MTKADLVEKVAKEADMTKKDAEQLVEIIFDSITGSLNKGEKIELRGFGSFRVRERNSRKGRNPKTGEAVEIPAKRVAYFKPGKELKEMKFSLCALCVLSRPVALFRCRSYARPEPTVNFPARGCYHRYRAVTRRDALLTI